MIYMDDIDALNELKEIKERLDKLIDNPALSPYQYSVGLMKLAKTIIDDAYIRLIIRVGESDWRDDLDHPR